jgi:hypothetical protein
MEQSVDDSSMLKDVKVDGPMPGMNALEYGINVLNGNSFGSRPERAAWKFTYDEGKKMYGSLRYEVPD